MQRSVSATLAAVGLSVLLAGGSSSAQTATPAPAAPTAAGTPAAPPPAAAPAPAGSAAAPSAKPADAKPPASSVTGGYSWTDKPRARKKRARIQRFDPTAPLATYPGFQMAADGTSRVWVSVTRAVDVQVRRAGSQVTFVLGGVEVGTRNNTNPLVTTHFNTPLQRARLVRDRAGALLVLELREAAQPTHKVSKGPYGTMVLEIALPRAQRIYADSVVPGEARGDRARPAASAPAPRPAGGTRGPAP